MIPLSITTDYCTSIGDPEPFLLRIAEAGFSHLHWCHHFNDDFVYMPSEKKAVRAMLAKYKLRILDVHGSYGNEKRYWSLLETERQSGVELVMNRAEFFAETEGEGHLIMHIPYISTTATEEANDLQRREYSQVIRSLDEIVPRLERLGVRLALENMPDDTWELLEQAVSRYPEKTVGFCYDSGHGNIHKTQLPLLDRNKTRLVALHTNDNNGVLDQHQTPYLGTVDWDRFAGIVAASPYRKPLSFEITMRASPFLSGDKPVPIPPMIQTFTGLGAQPEANQQAFLRDALEKCEKLSLAVTSCRKASLAGV